MIPRESKQDQGGALTVEYKLDNGYTLTSITGARQTRVHWLEDDDNSTKDFYVEDLRTQQRLWSEEARIASPVGKLFDYVAGLYYYHEDAAYYDPIYSGVDAGGPAMHFVNDRIQTVDSAAFVHGNIHVTSQLNLFGGLRYTDETQSIIGESQIGPASAWTYATFNTTGGFIAPLTLPASQHNSIKTDQLNWELGAEYHFTPNVMAYAKASTGFKGGGFNTSNGLAVLPEHLTAYEIGEKSTLFDKRLSLDTAVFYNDYSNLQVRSECISCVPIAIILQNAATVRAEGVDISLKAVPVDNLSIGVGIGYVDSKYVSFKNVKSVFGVIFDASGHALAQSPPWTYNAEATYSYPLANGGSLVGHVDGNYVGARYGSADGGQNSAYYALPAYSIANARFGYQAPASAWSMFVWVKNLTNVVAQTDKTYVPFSAALAEDEVTYNEPRTYGVTMRAKF